jgi:hypothetical protein
MAYARRDTGNDATWQRAWTADAFVDLASISAILGPLSPKHGDIAFVTAEGLYYHWADDGNWHQLPANAVAFTGLPGTPRFGMMVPVTDSNTAVWGAAIAGGGVNKVLAFYNGTNWTVAAI